MKAALGPTVVQWVVRKRWTEYIQVNTREYRVVHEEESRKGEQRTEHKQLYTRDGGGCTVTCGLSIYSSIGGKPRVVL